MDSKVQAVPLERYVRGVVSAEMPAEWPLAALEAQAIASRTYALTAHAGGSRFDVYSDTRSQVYRGVAAETAHTNAAVAATAGQIVTYAGKPAITYFFASSGGITENVQNGFLGAEPQPWLQGVPDAYETSKSSWKLSLELRHRRRPPAGPREGRLPGHRSAGPRLLAAHRRRRRARLRRRDPVSGPELAGAARLDSPPGRTSPCAPARAPSAASPTTAAGRHRRALLRARSDTGRRRRPRPRAKPRLQGRERARRLAGAG